MSSRSDTEQLPAGAGRFVRTNILKYDIVCDVAACGAEVAPGPEGASPVALTKFGELHLNAMRGPALNPAYEIADRNVRRYLDEHVDMLSRQNPFCTPNSSHTCLMIVRIRSRKAPSRTL